MSGRHDNLANMSAKHVFGKRRQKSFRETVLWLLDNQFVQLSPDDLFVYKVLQGSGMGLESSGDISDVCFFELVEKAFTLRPEVQEK